MTEEENLWSALLQEVQVNSNKGLPSSKNFLVLGDRLSGKTTLVAKLQGVEEPKKGSGLEYGYMEIRDDSFEYATNLGVHVLDGDPKHTNLLKYALSAESVPNTTVLICASMESPWLILSQIEKWSTILQDHLESLDIGEEEWAGLRAGLADRWQQYSEFVDFFDFSPTSDLTESQYKKDLQDRTCTHTLSRNLGCDIIVAITKTDSMVELETDLNYNDEKFDFIQQAVRKCCLALGASLLYVSVKENKNCDLLYKYLTHRIFNFSFNTPALVVERDALFIPAGWDSLAKIAILYENIRTFFPDQPYADVIRSPKLSKKYEPRVEVVADSEQDFLARIYHFLGDTTASPNHHQQDVAVEGVLKTPERRVYGSPGVYAVAKQRSSSGGGGVGSGLPGGVGVGSGGSSVGVSVQATSDGAISNFFHALLNKKSGQAALAASRAANAPGSGGITGFVSATTTGEESRLGQSNSTMAAGSGGGGGEAVEGMTRLPSDVVDSAVNTQESIET